VDVQGRGRQLLQDLDAGLDADDLR
jgi:hypothetical protein